MRSSRGFVLAWCAVYTLAAPPEERERRREEIRSHVWETCHARGPGWRTRFHLLIACVRGAAADLAWCDDVRRAAGATPLAAQMLVGPIGATVIAGVLIVTAFLSSLVERFFPAFEMVSRVTGLVAAAFVTVSVADRTLARRRRQREG